MLSFLELVFGRILFWWMSGAGFILLTFLLLHPSKKKFLSLYNAMPLFAVLLCLIISRGILFYLNEKNYGEHRYYLVISIALIIVLSISGDFIYRHWHSIYVKYGLIIISVAICVITGYIVYPRKQKTFLKDFVQTIQQEENSNQSVLIDFSGDGIRIAQKIPGLKVIPFSRKSAEDLEYHESIKYFFPGLLFDYETIWILTSNKNDNAMNIFSLPTEKLMEYNYRKNHYVLSKIDCNHQRNFINISMPKEIFVSPDMKEIRIDFFSNIPDFWKASYIEIKTPHGKTYNGDWIMHTAEMQSDKIPWEAIYYKRNGMPFARAFTWIKKTDNSTLSQKETIINYPDITMMNEYPEPHSTTLRIPYGKPLPPVSLAGLLGWDDNCSQDIEVEYDGGKRILPANDKSFMSSLSSSFLRIKYESKEINVLLDSISNLPLTKETTLLMVAGNTFWWGPLENEINKSFQTLKIKLKSDHVFFDYLLDCKDLLKEKWSSNTNPIFDTMNGAVSLKDDIKKNNKVDAFFLIPGVGSLMNYPDPFLVPESKNEIMEQKETLDKMIHVFRDYNPDIKIGIATIPDGMFTNETCGLIPGSHTPRTMNYRRNEFNQMLIDYCAESKNVDIIPMHAYQWPPVTELKRKDSYTDRMIDHSFWPLSNDRIKGLLTLIEYWLSKPDINSSSAIASEDKETK